jgi:MOSC domain-containing protein YiiM
MSAAGKPCMRLNKALDLLRRKGAQIMLVHTKDGVEYYVDPGGRVRSDDALKILARPDVVASDDGLFLGNSQTWQMESQK